MTNGKETREKLFSKAPGWIWSIAGAISLISFSLSVSFRMMDFNPGPILEKRMESGSILPGKNFCDNQDLLNRIEELETLSHEPSK